MADRYGSRIVLIYASLLITIGGTLLPLFPDFAWILSWRILIGLGSGAAFVAGARISATLGKHSSLGQGLYGGAVQIGSGLGLLVTPFMLTAFGWRWSFAIWGLFNLGSVIAWLLVDNGEQAHISSKVNLRAGLRSKSVWSLGLAHMGTFGLGNAVAAWIAIYLLHQYGLPLGVAATLGSVTLLAGIFFRPLGGFLLAHNLIGPISLLRLGTSMACLGVILLAIPIKSSILSIVGMGLIGIGATMPYAPVFNLAAKLRDVSTGVAQGLISVLSCPTVLIGPPLMGFLFERTGNFSLAFAAIALFGLIAVISSFLAGPAINQEASEMQ
jgi:nitrate/nitrite transporter NarK